MLKSATRGHLESRRAWDSHGQAHFNTKSRATKEAGSIILSPWLKTWEPAINLGIPDPGVIVQLSSDKKRRVSQLLDREEVDFLFHLGPQWLDGTTICLCQSICSGGSCLWKPASWLSNKQHGGNSALSLPFIESLIPYSWHLKLTITVTTAGICHEDSFISWAVMRDTCRDMVQDEVRQKHAARLWKTWRPA